MPIRPPALDDRSFDDLMHELLARIPAHTPEWTHPRVGDPGRTLIELFAWLVDTLLYRANLIPERQRLAFLLLLGVPLRPAVPARGIVRVQPGDDLVAPQPIRAAATAAGPVPFETRSELTVLPVAAAAYIKRRLDADERSGLGDVVVGLQQLYQLDAPPEPYVTTPVFPDGAPDLAGLDLMERAVDRCLWLALLAGKADQVAVAKSALAGRIEGRPHLLNVGIVPAVQVPALFEAIGARAKVGHAWDLTHLDPVSGAVQFRTLAPVADSTEGLTRAGVQRLELTGLDSVGAPSNDVRQAFKAGVGDLPPRLDDAERAGRLVAWLRLRPTVPLHRLALSWVGINAVEVDQRQTLTDRIIGAGDGTADQELPLPGQAVDPETLDLQVDEPGLGFRTWRQVDDLALAGPDDAAYRLDSEAGLVQFGNGLQGRILARGRRVRVARMRAGGGQAGNLPPGSLATITAVGLDGAPVVRPLAVAQDLPMLGGEDAETLADAERRIPATLRHRDRAVTTDDFRQLAAATPGVRLGRVEVMPRFKPQQRRQDVPGVVSVMVLPLREGLMPPNPRPDRPMLEAVAAHLEPRRLATTELYVIGCEYEPLALSIGVSVLDGFARDEVLHAVGQELRRALWPLPPGGPRGEGYPRGRPVRDRELEVVAARVAGVDEVASVNVFEAGPGDSWRRLERGTAGTAVELPLRPWQLPELLALVVAVDDEAPPDLAGAPGPLGSGRVGVAVPVVPKVC